MLATWSNILLIVQADTTTFFLLILQAYNIYVPFSLHPDKKWQWIIILINIARCEILSVFCAFQAISTILDKQSMLFVDTADMLARMSRETLVKARWGRSASS